MGKNRMAKEGIFYSTVTQFIYVGGIYDRWFKWYKPIFFTIEDWQHQGEE